MHFRNRRLSILFVGAAAFLMFVNPTSASAQQSPFCAKVIRDTDVFNDRRNDPYCTNNPPICDRNHRAEAGFRYHVERWNAFWWLVYSHRFPSERGWVAAYAVEPFLCPYGMRQMQQKLTKTKSGSK